MRERSGRWSWTSTRTGSRSTRMAGPAVQARRSCSQPWSGRRCAISRRTIATSSPCSRGDAVSDSDRRREPSSPIDPGLALLPLRLFLGITFAYAGIQKLSDPGYLHPGAPTYIGTQLHAFAHGTPGGFLLRAFAIPHPVLSGVGVALAEIAVGLLVTAGILTRAAAAVGFALNLLLFLTNSWHTYPYFLGSDIVFVFAWFPFVVLGASRQPTLQTVLHRLVVELTAGRRRPAPLDTRGAGRYGSQSG